MLSCWENLGTVGAEPAARNVASIEDAEESIFSVTGGGFADDLPPVLASSWLSAGKQGHLLLCLAPEGACSL